MTKTLRYTISFDPKSKEDLEEVIAMCQHRLMKLGLRSHDVKPRKRAAGPINLGDIGEPYDEPGCAACGPPVVLRTGPCVAPPMGTSDIHSLFSALQVTAMGSGHPHQTGDISVRFFTGNPAEFGLDLRLTLDSGTLVPGAYAAPESTACDIDMEAIYTKCRKMGLTGDLTWSMWWKGIMYGTGKIHVNAIRR